MLADIASTDEVEDRKRDSKSIVSVAFYVYFEILLLTYSIFLLTNQKNDKLLKKIIIYYSIIYKKHI